MDDDGPHFRKAPHSSPLCIVTMRSSNHEMGILASLPLTYHAYAFFSPSLPPFFFCFAFLLSRFFKPVIPILHNSAYLAKNPSRSSGWTMVAILIFFLRFSLDFPFVARMSIGDGVDGERSENCGGGESEDGETGSAFG
jgi:hypothetical protein